jgi:methionyl-tRNA formyltransferase
LATNQLSESETLEQLERVDPDVCLCAGWTEIIPQDVLSVPNDTFLGIHASTLPKNRGGAPVNWAIIRGESEVGLSIFEFVAEVDDGDVFAQTTVPVEPRDDVQTVYQRVTMAARELAIETLAEIATGEAKPMSQDRSKATYLPQRKPEDGIVDWARPASAIINWVRALTDPYPGAFTFYNGQRVTIWSAERATVQSEAVPGTITAVEDGAGVVVAADDGAVRLEQIQFADEPRGWADDIAASAGLGPRDTIGQPSDYPDWTYTGIRDDNGGFEYETNVQTGDTAELQAVAWSHTTEVPLQITAKLNGTTILDRMVSLDGSVTVPIVADPENSVNTLQVSFETPDRTDTRYLKIYVPKSSTDG